MAYRLACKMVNAGHQVTVFCACLDGSPRQETLSGVKVIRLPALKLPRIGLTHNFQWFGFTLLPWNLITLRRFFRQNKVDIIHSHNHIFDLSIAAVWMARYARVPLALTLHTIAQHPAPLSNAALRVLDSTLAKYMVVRKADAVISVDVQMKEYIQRRFGVCQTSMIPYGIDLPDIKAADRQRIRAQYNLGNGPVILSLGHLHALRDRKELIHAMPLILSRRPDARLLIVGDVCIKTPERWIAELGLEGKVILTGAVPQKEVPAFLSAADIEAHWLANVAGISLAGMEAMAAGLPIVTVEFSNEEEANGLVSWENIVTVPRNNPKAVAEAILRLLDSPDLRHRLGQNGKRYIIERFSWDSVGRQSEKLYRDLIDRATASEEK